jgi:hypothetical protein
MKLRVAYFAFLNLALFITQCDCKFSFYYRLGIAAGEIIAFRHAQTEAKLMEIRCESY